jgi:hypothetical protein
MNFAEKFKILFSLFLIHSKERLLQFRNFVISFSRKFTFLLADLFVIFLRADPNISKNLEVFLVRYYLSCEIYFIQLPFDFLVENF